MDRMKPVVTRLFRTDLSVVSGTMVTSLGSLPIHLSVVSGTMATSLGSLPIHLSSYHLVIYGPAIDKHNSVV
jgi:hypothetical protein